MIGEFYQWLWFHSEFMLTPVDRRPFTFIARDWIFLYPIQAMPLITIWYASMFILLFQYPLFAGISLAVSSFVLGHIVFGSKWIEGQQENPEYLGED